MRKSLRTYKTILASILVISISFISFIGNLPIGVMNVHAATTIDITSSPYNAIANDNIDDSAAINAAITAAQSGDTVYIPNGTFTTTISISVKNGVNINGAGQNTAILKFTGTTDIIQMVYMRNCTTTSGTTLSNFTLDLNDNANARAGINCAFNSYVKMSFLTIKNMPNNGTTYGPQAIYAGSSLAYSEISDCSIENIGLGDTSASGIELAWTSSNTKILRNTIQNTGRNGISCHDNSANLTIQNNNISGTGAGGTGTAIAIEVKGGCHNTVIEDNVVDHWISLDSSNYVAIRRNTISDTGTAGYCGLECIAVNNSIYTDNKVLSGQQVGIAITNNATKQYDFWGYNTINGCTQSGVNCQGGTDYGKYHYFYKNDISNNAGPGINFNGNIDYFTFNNCKVSGNAQQGVKFQSATNVDHLSFENFTDTGNTGAGFSTYVPGYTALELSNTTVNSNGGGNTLPTAISFNNNKPTAVMTCPDYGIVGTAVSFSSTNSTDDGSIARTLWDFNDGIPDGNASTTHTFTKPGIYRVSMLIWDNLGRGSIAEKQIIIGYSKNGDEGFETAGNPTTPVHSGTYSVLPTIGTPINKYFTTSYGIQEGWFYDDGVSTSSGYIYIQDGNTPELTRYYVGVLGNSSTYYCIRTGHPSDSTTITSIVRSQGWHRVIFDFTKVDKKVVYLDGIELLSQIDIHAGGMLLRAVRGAGNIYFDDFRSFTTQNNAEGFETNANRSTVQKHTGSYSLLPPVNTNVDKFYTMKSGIHEAWIYDDGVSGNNAYVYLSDSANPSTTWYYVGMSSSISDPTKYYIRSAYPTDITTVTGITRSVGWHRILFDFTNPFKRVVYIDATEILSQDGVHKGSMVVRASRSTGTTAYFDDFNSYMAAQ